MNDSAHSSEAQASAYGAQMAKYFTLNQPPHVAIDSAVSVVRPQLAITRLIARSGIPERTASIPAEKAYVVSVHLNHANSGEWELWTDEKYTKTGAWPVGGVAMCDLESNSSIRNPGAIDWVHFHVPRTTLDSLTDDAGMRQVKRLHCVYGTPDPVLHHLTQSILPCLNRPEMFSQLFMDSFTMTVCSHLVGRYGQLHEPTLQLKGGLAPWQMRRAVELLHEHLDGELKLETLAEELPAFGQPFCAIVQKIVRDLPTSLPDSAARGDREGPSFRNEQLAGGNCCADRIFRSSRPDPDFCKRRRRDSGKVEA